MQSPTNCRVSLQGGLRSGVPYRDSFEGLFSRSVKHSPFELQDQKVVRRSVSVPHKTQGCRESNPFQHPFEAPEKKITLFALRLAVLEKAASGLGSLAFIWATVVLLGGIADSLKVIDFWFMTIILLTEGTRIFSRSQELEWQHETLITSIRNDPTYDEPQSFRSFKTKNSSATFVKRIFAPFISANGRNGDPVRVRRGLSVKRSSKNLGKRERALRTAPFLPYTGWFFVSRHVSRLLYGLQLLSAATCAVLSVSRLVYQKFGSDGNKKIENLGVILNVFYGLSLAEALIFLGERIYWQWQISVRNLLREVTKECGLDDTSGPYAIRSFFYDTYSACVRGSIFDGLKLDLVFFAKDLLQSSGSHGQLSGARLLSAFLHNERFLEDALRKIGSMQDAVERLLEMLNWQNPQAEEIRREAAEILSQLVKKNRNCVRIAWIPGSLESIASLLSSEGIQQSRHGGEIMNEIGQIASPLTQYDYSGFSLLGLKILKNLARDGDTCTRIGTTRGLLPRIIEFTAVSNDPLLQKSYSKSDPKIKIVKRSLQLLQMLSSSSGATGKHLRQQISGVVFAISNLRDILELTDHAILQTFAIDVLTNLALGDDSRERIGATGGILRNLFSLFFLSEGDGCQAQLIVPRCGEALAVLAFHNANNCVRMIEFHIHSNNIISNLIAALNDPLRKLHAARILRNIWAYAGSQNFHAPMKEVAAAASQMIKVMMEEEQGKVQEAAVGLLAGIFELMNVTVVDGVLKAAETTKRCVMEQLINILEKHPCPSNKLPNIRRFSLELIICVTEKKKEHEEMYDYFRLQKAIAAVMDSTNEMENFCTFSGSMGLNRHYVTIQSLAQCVNDGLERYTH